MERITLIQIYLALSGTWLQGNEAGTPISQKNLINWPPRAEAATALPQNDIFKWPSGTEAGTPLLQKDLFKWPSGAESGTPSLQKDFFKWLSEAEGAEALTQKDLFKRPSGAEAWSPLLQKDVFKWPSGTEAGTALPSKELFKWPSGSTAGTGLPQKNLFEWQSGTEVGRAEPQKDLSKWSPEAETGRPSPFNDLFRRPFGTEAGTTLPLKDLYKWAFGTEAGTGPPVKDFFRKPSGTEMSKPLLQKDLLKWHPGTEPGTALAQNDLFLKLPRSEVATALSQKDLFEWPPYFDEMEMWPHVQQFTRPSLAKKKTPAAKTANQAPKKASPAPKKATPAPKKANPAPKKANPAPKKANPAPKKANPAPKKAIPAPKKNCYKGPPTPNLFKDSISWSPFEMSLPRNHSEPQDDLLIPQDDLWIPQDDLWIPQTDLSTLPPNFLLGVSTSAYQVEGAWDEDGKGESIWDHAVHQQRERMLEEGATGDVACDSYHKYKTDVQMVKDVGFNAYRFSLSWTRILPSGTLPNINKKGIQYYNSLIDELIKQGITPVVTLYHWDMPEELQELGGWTNPYVLDYFEDFARLAISSFGDRVKLWITINEPFSICELGYSEGWFAPFYDQAGEAGYLCNHNIILAHARVYRMYKTEFAHQKGNMGITFNSVWYEPETLSRKDLEASSRAMEFSLGWSANPVFGQNGDYPLVMRHRIDANSRAEGRHKSRLPTYTPQEIEFIKGSADFLGLNHYTTRLLTTDGPPEQPVANPSWQLDSYVKTFTDASSEGSGDLHEIVPWGLREVLNWIKCHYGNPPVLITESGIGDLDGRIDDYRRIRYFTVYMKEMLKAIYEDSCNVFGLTAWSLMDNFDWVGGYLIKYGLFQVDFDDPSRPRIPRKSAEWFKNVTQEWRIPE